MSAQDERGLIHDWNVSADADAVSAVTLHDETLRDGVQNPSVVDPPIADKLQVLHLLDAVGVASCDLGLPAAGPRAYDDALRLCREVADQGLRLQPTCAGRTLPSDLRPMVELSQQAGIAVEAMAFIGSSPIRQLVERWSVDQVRRHTAEAVRFVVRHGLPATYVTEDTTRSRPEVLAELFRTAIEEGATRICLCDTVGHATPAGVHRLVAFTQRIIEDSGADVAVDWHGHDDRGLALANALAAMEAGVDRLHGCVLGIGERVGNAPLDQLIINLALMGRLAPEGADLSQLAPLCRKVSEATGVPIPDTYPVMGADAYRTATGIHAAAIMKARAEGDARLADRVYSAVPASVFGRCQEIAVGPLSGSSNVVHWLETRGYRPEPELVARILSHAKAHDRLLTDVELHHLVAGHLRRAAG